MADGGDEVVDDETSPGSRYRRIVEALPDGVVLFDRDGRVVTTNERAASILGTSGEALSGESVTTLPLSVDDEPFETAFEAAIEGRSDDPEAGETLVVAREDTETGHRDLVELELRHCRPGPDGEPGVLGVIRPDPPTPGTEQYPYETIVEAVGDPVYVLDECGTITYVNEAAAEMVGQPVEELMGANGERLISREALERGQQVIERLVEGDRNRDTFEMQVVTGNGDRIPVENHVAVIRDDEGTFRGTAGVLRDVSDRKRRERELEQYETIVETIADPVYTTDERGQITFGNAAFEERTGYSSDYLREEGVHFTELTTAQDTQALLETIREIRSGTRRREYGEVEIDGITRDGERSPFEVRIALLPSEDDSFAGTAGVLRDVSDRERRQQVLSVMNRTLRHNLRTKVNTISGYAEILSSEVPAEKTEFVDCIQNATEWLLYLGEALRTLEQAVEQERADETIPDGAALIEDVVGDVSDEHPDASVETHLELDVGLDAGRALRHAIGQVVENAIVHHDRETPNVRVYATDGPKDGWIDVHVEDDGPGIPEDERQLVLGDASADQLHHGSGIGLWITNWIVTVFDGELHIEDNDPRGTVVTLRVKRSDAHQSGR